MGWRPRRPTFEWMVSVCTQHTASPGSLLRRSRQSTTSLSAPPVATKPVTLTSIESTGSLPCHAICGVIALQGTAGGMVVRGVGNSRLARREERGGGKAKDLQTDGLVVSRLIYLHPTDRQTDA